MRHLGSISGPGELFAGGASIGPVRYAIDIREEANTKEARGRIEGDDVTLFKASEADHIALRLMDGVHVEIIIASHAVGTGEADILVITPIPGF
jgi:hypothetical protein